MARAGGKVFGRLGIVTGIAVAAIAGAAMAGGDVLVTSVSPEEQCGSLSGTRPSIAVDSLLQPHIVSDRSATINKLYIWHKVNGQWSQTLLAEGTDGGQIDASRLFLPHMEIDSYDRAWISCKFGVKDFGPPYEDHMMGQGLWLVDGLTAAPHTDWFRWVRADTETHKGNGNVSLDPAYTNSGVVLATGGVWVRINDKREKIANGNMNSGNSGEKIRFLISPRPGQDGIWHSAMSGWHVQPSSYQNSLRRALNLQPVEWASYSVYPEQGGDYAHPCVGIDLANPEICYITCYYHTGLVLNIWDGTKMLFNSASLPVLDPAMTNPDRWAAQLTPVPGGGTFAVWSRGGRVRMRYIAPDGSFGAEQDICVGTQPTACTDRDGKIHIAYANGGMRYRMLTTVLKWDAGYQDLGNGWRRLSWFGDYISLGNDWIWHKEHDYMYTSPPSTPQNIFFFMPGMAWLWTSSTMYPFLYRVSDGDTLWYKVGSDNLRWFYNVTDSTWESL